MDDLMVVSSHRQSRLLTLAARIQMMRLLPGGIGRQVVDEVGDVRT